MKRASSVRLYHLNCLEKVHVFGFVDEFKTCALVNEIPKDSLPVFERRPSFVNKNELNTFQVSDILKNSQAEIKDRTRISKDPNQSIMPEYNQHYLLLQKKDEELGNSFFISKDIIKDKQLQIETSNEDKDDTNKVIEEIINKDKQKKKKELSENKPKRELVYKEELDKDPIDELEFIDNFYSTLKQSKILLPSQEKKILSYDPEVN